MNCESQTPAEIIRDQIGGKAFLMMGTNQMFQNDDGRTFTFNVRGSKIANKIQVTLTDRDDYLVSSFKVGRGKCSWVSDRVGVYAHNLRAVIEDLTGLYLSL